MEVPLAEGVEQFLHLTCIQVTWGLVKMQILIG